MPTLSAAALAVGKNSASVVMAFAPESRNWCANSSTCQGGLDHTSVYSSKQKLTEYVGFAGDNIPAACKTPHVIIGVSILFVLWTFLITVRPPRFYFEASAIHTQTLP